MAPDGNLESLEGGRWAAKGLQKEEEEAGAAPPLLLRRAAHNMSSSSSLRKRSELAAGLSSKVRWEPLRRLLGNLQEVLLGTKLCPLFAAVPLAVAAECYNFGTAWVFALSLIGLAPLAERVSFLSEQIAHHAGSTVSGLINATCGNVPELIIALLALHMDKIEVLKWSLLGSVLSNLLLVLGSSLLCGSLNNLNNELPFDQKQADASLGLLLLCGLCHVLVLMYRYAVSSGEYNGVEVVWALGLSRSMSIAMLAAYFGCLLFQLKTHRQLFVEPEDEVESDGDIVSETPVMGFTSAFIWLAAMTALVAVLSENVVSTIEAASKSWGLPVSFTSIILLPIVGNVAEHACAINFAFKNKIDITLGVTLGSATQISMFLVPLCVIVAWIKGVDLDLDFKLLETGSLVSTILITGFTLQDGSWHYMKGFVLLLCYIVIGAVFFVLRTSEHEANVVNMDIKCEGLAQRIGFPCT